MSAKSSVYNRLPIHLRGEIIQIGAVKLNDDMTPGEEFQVDVKPVYFRKMHFKVKKLTGIDSERLKDAGGFVEAMEAFRDRLNERGITATIRASRGEDIDAACGMLAGKNIQKQD